MPKSNIVNYVIPGPLVIMTTFPVFMLRSCLEYCALVSNRHINVPIPLKHLHFRTRAQCKSDASSPIEGTALVCKKDQHVLHSQFFLGHGETQTQTFRIFSFQYRTVVKMVLHMFIAWSSFCDKK